MKFRPFPGMVAIIAIAQALIWHNFWVTFAFLVYFCVMASLTQWCLRIIMKHNIVQERKK